MNVTLIGMPASGKSYLGRRLAKKLDFKFIDSDTIIELEYGMPLQRILEKLGSEEFLRKEGKVLRSQIEGKDGLVISPGGSIVYSNEAMEFLASVSTVIYLTAAPEVLEQRIARKPRGIVGLDTKTFREIYDERAPLYEKWADIEISTDSEKEQEILEKISGFLDGKMKG